MFTKQAGLYLKIPKVQQYNFCLGCNCRIVLYQIKYRNRWYDEQPFSSTQFPSTTSLPFEWAVSQRAWGRTRRSTWKAAASPSSSKAAVRTWTSSLAPKRRPGNGSAACRKLSPAWTTSAVNKRQNSILIMAWHFTKLVSLLSWITNFLFFLHACIYSLH